MTAALATTRLILPTRQPRPHTGAFLAALVLAPLTVGALGFALIVPAFAVVIGGPAYLILGGPALWFAARGWHRALPRRRFWLFPLAAFVANFGTLPLYQLHEVLTQGQHVAGSGGAPAGIALMGMVFAPIWGAVMGLFYGWFVPRRMLPAPRITGAVRA